MKRIGIIMVSLLMVMIVSRAQNVQVIKEARITRNEVPVEVLQSFERDFHSLGVLTLRANGLSNIRQPMFFRERNCPLRCTIPLN